MNNIGTVSTFQSLMFFAFFMLPLVVLSIRCLVAAFYKNTVYVNRNVPVEVPVYITKTVYVDRETPAKSAGSNKKKTKTVVETSSKIKKEVLEALRGIGLSSTEARKLISKTTKNRNYKSAQQLVKDCIANI